MTHCVDNWLWKRLWTCHKTRLRNEWSWPALRQAHHQAQNACTTGKEDTTQMQMTFPARRWSNNAPSVHQAVPRSKPIKTISYLRSSMLSWLLAGNAVIPLTHPPNPILCVRNTHKLNAVSTDRTAIWRGTAWRDTFDLKSYRNLNKQ